MCIADDKKSYDQLAAENTELRNEISSLKKALQRACIWVNMVPVHILPKECKDANNTPQTNLIREYMSKGSRVPKLELNQINQLYCGIHCPHCCAILFAPINSKGPCWACGKEVRT